MYRWWPPGRHHRYIHASGGGEIDPGGGMVPGPDVLHDSALGSVSSSGLASGGGVRDAGGRSRSSMSSRFPAFASREGMAGRVHLASTSAQMPVWSYTGCETGRGRAPGEAIANRP